MGKLKDWAIKNAQYLKIEADVDIFFKFIGFESFVDKDNDDKAKVRYHVECGGFEKSFESQSIALAEKMDEFEEGDWVKLKKTGTGRNTKYEVSAVPEPK